MMSSKGATVDPAALPEISETRATLGSGRLVWIWVALACAMLIGSWAVRTWQDRRFSQEATYVEECPFPLKQISQNLGVWRMVEGGELALDTPTARITGCTEYIMRNYVDESTGVTLRVLVLFGPAEPVVPHTPQVCFPATGYTEIESVLDRAVMADDGKSYLFRTAIYGKPGGRLYLREEAYHSFRLEGVWSPNTNLGQKFSRKNPGVFKVQVQRMVAVGEHRGRDNPIEQFLGVLVPEIERRVSASQPGSAPSRAPASSTLKKSTGDSSPSTTIRAIPLANTFAIVGDDSDWDADRRATGGSSHRGERLDREASRQADTADRQDEDQDRRKVKSHRQVSQKTNRVTPAFVNFGHARIKPVSAIVHAENSSEPAGLKSGREIDRDRDEAKAPSTRGGRGLRSRPMFAEVGNPERLERRIIHRRSASGQSGSHEPSEE